MRTPNGLLTKFPVRKRLLRAKGVASMSVAIEPCLSTRDRLRAVYYHWAQERLDPVLRAWLHRLVTPFSIRFPQIFFVEPWHHGVISIAYCRCLIDVAFEIPAIGSAYAGYFGATCTVHLPQQMPQILDLHEGHYSLRSRDQVAADIHRVFRFGATPELAVDPLKAGLW